MPALITLVAPTGPQNISLTGIPVRLLEPNDLPELTSLHRHAHTGAAAQPSGGDTAGHGAPETVHLGRTIEEASLATCGPDGQITAAIIITDHHGEAVITELCTHPDHRRQGLAEELLRHGIHALHTLGRATVTVTVEENNAAAMALYLSRDFRRNTDDDTDTYYA